MARRCRVRRSFFMCWRGVGGRARACFLRPLCLIVCADEVVATAAAAAADAGVRAPERRAAKYHAALRLPLTISVDELPVVWVRGRYLCSWTIAVCVCVCVGGRRCDGLDLSRGLLLAWQWRVRQGPPRGTGIYVWRGGPCVAVSRRGALDVPILRERRSERKAAHACVEWSGRRPAMHEGASFFSFCEGVACVSV